MAAAVAGEVRAPLALVIGEQLQRLASCLEALLQDLPAYRGGLLVRLSDDRLGVWRVLVVEVLELALLVPDLVAQGPMLVGQVPGDRLDLVALLPVRPRRRIGPNGPEARPPRPHPGPIIPGPIIPGPISSYR